MDKAPEIIKEESKDLQASANDQLVADEQTFQNLMALGQMENIASGGHGMDPVDMEDVGHKFGLPVLPLAKNNHLKYRYDVVVNQVTNLIMRHGKKSVAQRVSSSVSILHVSNPLERSCLTLVPLTEHVIHIKSSPYSASSGSQPSATSASRHPTTRTTSTQSCPIPYHRHRFRSASGTYSPTERCRRRRSCSSDSRSAGCQAAKTTGYAMDYRLCQQKAI
jgi:hypothetical protein